MGQYFTRDTDAAISEFLKIEAQAAKETDPKLKVELDKRKNEVFDRGIRPAFEKLVESLVFVYHFFNLDDVDTLKRECMSNLYEMLPKFDPNKGKGFSYFNVVAKNWFIHKTRERNRKNKLESELYVSLDHEVARSDPSFIVDPIEESAMDREKWLSFYDAMDSWKYELTKKSEIQVLEAVKYIMTHSDLVNIYNKKAVYLYLRELTSLNSKQIVVCLKRIKELYDEWAKEFDETGEMP